MSPAYSMLRTPKSFANAKIKWVENTPEILELATKEMLERIFGSSSSIIPDDDLQHRFKVLAETCGVEYCSSPVKAFAPISRDFLEMHVDLLRD